MAPDKPIIDVSRVCIIYTTPNDSFVAMPKDIYEQLKQLFTAIGNERVSKE